MIIDAVNGAMWKLEPNQIMVSLVTASVNKFDTQIYAVFRALDDKGQVRTLVIPLLKDNS
jgi:hypothetical protein